MNLTKMTEDLNFISGLADQPTSTSSELKGMFDKAGNTIKNFINNTLITDIQSGVNDDINSAKTTILNAVDDSLEELETTINEQITEKLEEIEESMQTAIENTASKAVNLQLSSGVTANQRNFKINNMIMLDSLVQTSVAPNATKQIATVPEGYRPKETISFTALGSSLDSDGTEFAFYRKTVTITPEGIVSVANTTPNELGKTTLKYLILRTNYLI